MNAKTDPLGSGGMKRKKPGSNGVLVAGSVVVGDGSTAVTDDDSQIDYKEVLAGTPMSAADCTQRLLRVPQGVFGPPWRGAQRQGEVALLWQMSMF